MDTFNGASNNVLDEVPHVEFIYRYGLILAYIIESNPNLTSRSIKLRKYMLEYLPACTKNGKRIYHDYTATSDVLTPLYVITATVGLQTSLRNQYENLSKQAHIFKEPIKAIASNLVPMELLVNNPYTKALDLSIKAKKRNEKTKVKARACIGNGLYFQCAVEYKVSWIEGKKYNVRVSGNQGSIQMHGLDSPIIANATYMVNVVINDLSEKINAPIYTSEGKIVLLNSRCKLKDLTPNLTFKLKRLAQILRDIYYNQDTSQFYLPYYMQSTTSPDDMNNAITVKFLTSTDINADRVVSIRIFSKGCVNIVGSFHPYVTTQMYHFISDVVNVYKNEIMVNSNLLQMENTVKGRQRVEDFIGNIKRVPNWVNKLSI